MSITAISSSTSAQTHQADGDSPAVEAAESGKTKAAEQANGGSKPQTAPASAAYLSSNASSSSSDTNKLRLLAAQHLPLATIAQRLGKSVSTILQEAAAAGICLNADSTINAAAVENTDTEAVGNEIDLTA